MAFLHSEKSLKIRISNLGRIVTGKTPPTKQQEYYGMNYPFITPTDITDKTPSVYPAHFISELGRKKHESAMIPKGSVCFTCIASVGKMCITDRLSLTNQQINSILVKKDQYDPKYVYYLLRVETDRIKSIASGVATPIINKSMFSEIELEVLSFPTQQKIAAILSAYDDLIENNTQRIKILEEITQAVYREWFVNFRFPGHEGVRMVESEQGLVPEGWELRKLGDIAEEVRRNVEPNTFDSDTPYFGLEHIPRKSIALSDWGFAKDVQSTKHQFFKGEILFGKIRPYFHKVGVAPVDGVCSSDAIVIRQKKPEYFGIVLFCVSSEDFVSQATQTSQGTKMPRANWNVLVNYPVVIPPKALLDEFNNIAFDTVDLIITKIFQNANLRRTRDLLLPKLISGELDVSELEILIPEEMVA